MTRRKSLKPERDERGQPLRARVTTTILAENYNVAVRQGLDFGHVLDGALRARKALLELPTDPLRRWVAERSRAGLTTSPEQVAVKKAELVAKGWTPEDPL